MFLVHVQFLFFYIYNNQCMFQEYKTFSLSILINFTNFLYFIFLTNLSQGLSNPFNSWIKEKNCITILILIIVGDIWLLYMFLEYWYIKENVHPCCMLFCFKIQSIVMTMYYSDLCAKYEYVLKLFLKFCFQPDSGWAKSLAFLQIYPKCEYYQQFQTYSNCVL